MTTTQNPRTLASSLALYAAGDFTTDFDFMVREGYGDRFISEDDFATPDAGLVEHDMLTEDFVAACYPLTWDAQANVSEADWEFFRMETFNELSH